VGYNWGVVVGWVGNVSKAGKKKGNWVRCGEKIKFPKKKTEIGTEKGQTKKLNLEWHMDRKENPISAPSIHPSKLVHLCVLVHPGPLFILLV